MIKGAENSELYTSHFEAVVLPEAQEAFVYIVGVASSLTDYECFPSSHGFIKDYRFYRKGEWELAFVPNKQWLLFYFRRPYFAGDNSLPIDLKAAFPDGKEAQAGEFTVRIASLDMARKVMRFIRDRQATPL